MKKYLFLSLITTATILLALPWAAFAQEYTLLEPLPGTGIGEKIAINSQGLSAYVQAVFNIGIGVAIALAVVMIVFGGIQYLSTDAVGKKKEGLDKLWNALIGLLLALGAYVIIATVNPDILKFNLAIAPLPKAETPQKKPATESTGNQTGTILPVYKMCNDCVSLASTGVPFKAPGPAFGTGGCLNRDDGCKVNRDLGARLTAFKVNLGSGISWTVSESWPPTRNHKSTCHQDGTCVDVSISVNQRSATVIKRMIEAAEKAGITAQYETGESVRATQLRAQGVGVILVPGITGEHFSFYKK